MKNFCTAKETVDRKNRHSTEQEKISISYTSDEGLISRAYKELQESNTKEIKQPINTGAKNLKRHFSKKKNK